MRIIEPTSNRESSKKQVNKTVVVLLMIGLAGLLLFYLLGKNNGDINPASSSSNNVDTSDAQPERPDFSKMSGEQIKQFINNIAYPNVSEITTKPEITGVIEADARIRQLAEERGYLQRAIPNTSLVEVDSYLLQQKAVPDWQDLKKRAQAASLDLELSSGFRPVDEQRELFNQRLRQAGVIPGNVAAGSLDGAIINVLKAAALPGYSKHHTGYTIDLTCNGVGLHAFKTTPCGRWLDADNYANAIKSGWMPSYPEGASLQGPDPEPWEYVWIGRPD